MKKELNMCRVNKKIVIIEELLNAIYNGNIGYFDNPKFPYEKMIDNITKKDLEDYLCGYKLYGTKIEMLKQMCEVCNGIDINYEIRNKI